MAALQNQDSGVAYFRPMDTFSPILKRVLEDGRSGISSFLLLSGIGLVMIPIDFYGLVPSRRLIDKGFMAQSWETTRGILVILILLFLVRSLVTYGTSVFSTRLQLRMNQGFQNRLFSHILHLPVSFFAQEPTGRLMSRLLEDATRFSFTLNLLFGPSLSNPLRLMALLFFLMYTSVQMCLLMLISALFSFLVIHRVGKRMRVISKEIQDKDAAIYSYVEQVFPNIELIKSKITQGETAHHFHRLLGEMIQLMLRELRISLVANPLMQLLKYLALGSCFAYGGWLITRSHFSFGALTSFLGATYLFFNTLDSLGSNYRFFRAGLARMEILYGIIDSPPERSASRPEPAAISPLDSIEFRNVSFRYQPSKPVLREVSFGVSRGETLGITGQSGSGKTTLARLLLHFCEPDSGEVRLNGRPLGEFPLDSLRSSIGIAFQENLMLNRTIRENIAYGDATLSMERIIHAAEVSHAHDFIRMLPHQYETMIGEAGKGISGGERQRIAIARALVTDPEILILDEVTSFLEVDQEEAILNSIKETRKGKITVIISHRLSAIRQADRILTLDNGRILESDFQILAEIGRGRPVGHTEGKRGAL